ncbi:MAG TPA: nucleotide exchange factor GrpE, partial [Blastocatellia bacterium]|nr:nucleotide exchange factor GrpE [Blastocatellia bacterium]
MHNPEMTINHTKQHLEFQQYEKPEVAELQSETRRLKEENERIKSELQREHEMYVSNLADFDHYRRRVERERVQSAQAGKRELILSLLDV